MTPGPARLDLALLAVGIAGVATSGPVIAATAAPALAIAFWRNALGTLVVGAVSVGTQWSRLRAASHRVLALSAVSGLLLAAHFALWIPSLRYTSVASSTAIVSLQAVWTAMLGRLAGERLGGRAWAGIALAIVGVLAMTGVDLSLSTRALAGDAMALGGGLFAAFYVVVGARVRRELPAASYTAVCYGVCALALLAGCLAGGVALTGYPSDAWLGILAVTVAAQLLGHTAFNVVLRSVPPTVLSVAILLEVPGAALLAAVWLGQTPPAAALPALALVLAGTALVVVARPGPPALAD
ncbi:DMT family transporter [Motilibacter sp. K478]|nr:DMT family transporter [Motilibacter aurantiacus]